MKPRPVPGTSLWRAGIGVIRDLGRDARHGARLHLKSPGFALVAAVALAVGIGANLAVFGFVNTLLLRPLPVLEPERLICADLGGPNFVENDVPYDDYEEYRDRNQTLSALGLFHPGGILPVVARQRPPEPMHVMPVTGNYFDVLGIAPAIGRSFRANDDRRNAGAVVLSHEGWTRHFGGDPGIVGDTLLISGVPFDVVGVTSPSFTGTVPPLVPRIYATWNAFPFSAPAPRGFMIGRLDDGSAIDAARADFARMAAQLRTERTGRYPLRCTRQPRACRARSACSRCLPRCSW